MRHPTIPNSQVRPCDLCGGRLHNGSLVAGCRVTIERIVVDVSAARALAGLAGMFGPGGGGIAAAFAPGDALTVPAELREQLLVCETCAAAGEHSLLSMVETASERRMAIDQEEG